MSIPQTLLVIYSGRIIIAHTRTGMCFTDIINNFSATSDIE